MLALQIALLLVLLMVCSVVPGFVVVRWLRWNPLETLGASIGLSLFLIYLVTFTLYWLDLDWRWCWAVTGLWVVLGAGHAGPLARLWRCPQVRRAVAGFGLLLGWTLVLLALVRHYAGGGWGGDWVEHFQRTMFFLKHLPVKTVIFPIYQLPARPPLMNLLAVYFLAQTEFRFELFQVTFAFLNLLAFFPCGLLVKALVPHGSRSRTGLIGLLALNPVFLQNSIYPWTKLLAVFYVLLGLWFYLAGWRKQCAARTVAGFASFAAGALVHYSAGPYIAFVLGHYLVRVGRNWRAHGRELLVTAVVSAAMLSTWFAWSISVYGIKTTLTNNTAVTPVHAASVSLPVKIALNTFDTLVPHFLRSDAETQTLQQTSLAGYWRDYLFLIYQPNLIMGMGLVGGVVVLALFWCAMRKLRSVPLRRERWFWLGLVIFCTLVGTAVHGERDTFGVAHVALQPLVILGVVWLAASFRLLPRIVRGIVIAGCLFDFATGVFLNLHLENFEVDFANSPEALFHVREFRDKNGVPKEVIRWDVSTQAGENLAGKYLRAPMFGLPRNRHLEFLGDHAANLSGPLQGIVLGLAVLVAAGVGWETRSREAMARPPLPGGLSPGGKPAP